MYRPPFTYSDARRNAYAAICADPHDETLRDVYADLADEEGDPHGAIIRAAKRAKSDPAALRDPAAVREYEDLFGEFGRAAFLPLEGLDVDVKAEDGFVSTLRLPYVDDVSEEITEQVVAACQRAPMTVLDCDYAAPPTELLPALSRVTTVDAIEFTEENAGYLEGVRFASIVVCPPTLVKRGLFDHVRELDLPPGPVDHIAQFSHELEVLGAHSIHPALGELPKLRELRLTNVTPEPSFFTWRFPALRSLSISGGKWDPVALARFAQTHQLEKLSIEGVPLGSDFCDALSGAPLTRLQHDAVEFTYAGLSLPGLRSLHIGVQDWRFHRAATHIYDQLEEFYVYSGERGGLHSTKSSFPHLKKLTIEDFDDQMNRFSAWLDARPFRALESLTLYSADSGLSASFLQRAEKLEHLRVAEVNVRYLEHPLQTLALELQNEDQLAAYLRSSAAQSLRVLDVPLTNFTADALLNSDLVGLAQLCMHIHCDDDHVLALRRRFGHRFKWEFVNTRTRFDHDLSYFHD